MADQVLVIADRRVRGGAPAGARERRRARRGRPDGVRRRGPAAVPRRAAVRRRVREPARTSRPASCRRLAPELAFEPRSALDGGPGRPRRRAPPARPAATVAELDGVALLEIGADQGDAIVQRGRGPAPGRALHRDARPRRAGRGSCGSTCRPRERARPARPRWTGCRPRPARAGLPDPADRARPRRDRDRPRLPDLRPHGRGDPRGRRARRAGSRSRPGGWPARRRSTRTSSGLTEPIIGHQGAVVRAMPSAPTADRPRRPAVPRAGRAASSATRRWPPTAAREAIDWCLERGLDPHVNDLERIVVWRGDARLRGLLGLPRARGGDRAGPRGVDPPAGVEGHRGRRPAAADGADRGGAAGVRGARRRDGLAPAVPRVRRAGRVEGPGGRLAGAAGRDPDGPGDDRRATRSTTSR